MGCFFLDHCCILTTALPLVQGAALFIETGSCVKRDRHFQPIRGSEVVEQTRRQINQFQKGLKETGIWELLIHRRDVIPILFPRESEAQITPQMILDCIIWPSSITVVFESYEDKDGDEDDDNYDAIDVCRVCGYLKTFIENDFCLKKQFIDPCASLCSYTGHHGLADSGPDPDREMALSGPRPLAK
ncbi:hypothetical protein GBF38_015159 [Nibea albiflora]|uniref:Uncharacterized protein n=1 Tax=Nibea albiflora TaxID=240163 RepID=A0ACB7ELY6_NIBAL|nr:hypothetical protein GBF38_015159 [Nibea albiflora]